MKDSDVNFLLFLLFLFLFDTWCEFGLLFKLNIYFVYGGGIMIGFVAAYLLNRE